MHQVSGQLQDLNTIIKAKYAFFLVLFKQENSRKNYSCLKKRSVFKCSNFLFSKCKESSIADLKKYMFSGLTLLEVKPIFS